MDSAYVVDFILRDDRIDIQNRRTRSIYQTIPLKNFEKNAAGCLKSLFDLVIGYEDDGYEVNFMEILKVE